MKMKQNDQSQVQETSNERTMQSGREKTRVKKCLEFNEEGKKKMKAGENKRMAGLHTKRLKSMSGGDLEGFREKDKVRKKGTTGQKAGIIQNH